MKKKSKHYPLCKICKGEEVVYKKGDCPHGGYYEVCECSKPKEETEMSGAGDNQER
jgi:hypothetical protein